MALFTTLYAGSLAGTLALLALFLVGLDVIFLAAGEPPVEGAGAEAALAAFRFFNLLALAGGALGIFFAAHYDFSFGAQTFQKATLAALNLLAVPVMVFLQFGSGTAALWVVFVAGGLLASINLLTLIFCQYRMGEETLLAALRYAGLFALFLLTGGVLERLAFGAPSALWLRFAGNGLLLGASATAAFYALLMAREVWEPALAEFGDVPA